MRNVPSKLPPYLFAVLCLVLVALVSFVVFDWISTVRIAKSALREAQHDTRMMATETIESQAKFLNAANTSAINLARVLSWTLEGNLSSFSTIKNKVAPSLFLAQSTFPSLSQVSFVGGNGVFYSYQVEGNKKFAVFSNTSLMSFSNHSKQHWYEQLVNTITGVPYGNINVLSDLPMSSYDKLNMTLQHKTGYVKLSQGLGINQNLSFLFAVPLVETNGEEAKQGVIVLGISLDTFMEYVFKMGPIGGGLYLATKDGHVLAHRGVDIGFGDFNVEATLDGSCKISRENSTNSITLNGKFRLMCTPIDVVGIQLISMLVLPSKDVMHHVRMLSILALPLLLFILVMVALTTYTMFHLIRMYQKKEISLEASLVRQKEATRQEERKSKNKILAVASACHDVRGSLKGIESLAETCLMEVNGNPEMKKNLDMISSCAAKLLGILNPVLDLSKLEAGKLELEEVEFDMAQAIEESVDMFHFVALRKNVEVIWDPCDCSVLKSLKVRGDRRRFMQILDNLLSNAVKFTNEGYVVVRAWAKKNSRQTSKLPCNHDSRLPVRCFPLSWGSHQCDYAYGAMDHVNSARFDPGVIEFVFEVDDSGCGIPMEKRISVFENYVQVEGSSSEEGHQGTGLGLGIVQSFVRLMGGDIGILDKGNNERGSCFKFNVFLKTASALVEPQPGDDSCNSQTLHNIRTSLVSTSISPRSGESQNSNNSAEFSRDIRKDDVHVNVVLFVQGNETKRISKQLLESFGAKVWNVDLLHDFSSALDKVRNQLILDDSNALGIHKIKLRSSPSNVKDEGEIEGLLVPTGESHPNPFHNRRSSKCALIIVDASNQPLSEIYLRLKNFALGLDKNQYKVVWLADSNVPSRQLRSLENDRITCDHILSKPFHGSRLSELLNLLQEFGETHKIQSSNARIDVVVEINDPSQASSSNAPQLAPSSSDKTSEAMPKQTDGSPLNGMNILVVEDMELLRHVARKLLSGLGVNVATAANGAIAVDFVQQALTDFGDGGNASASISVGKHFAYDLILMDCEMPVMNGYEATRAIRNEEKRYSIHIPIVATSGHEFNEHEAKFNEAGMDFHLTKPLTKQKLLDIVQKLESLQE